jgi:Cu/Ag efflux protein CusF
MRNGSRGSWILGLVSLPLVLATACAGGERGEQRAEAQDRNVDRYVVRGEIVELSASDSPEREIEIRHEAIDGFKDIEGRVSGMDSMTMPFRLASDVSLAGLAPGDKVEFTLEIDWNVFPPNRITAISKLPPETELTFGAAHPPE